MFGVIYGPLELKISRKVGSLTLKSMPKLILNNFRITFENSKITTKTAKSAKNNVFGAFPERNDYIL